MEHFPGRVAFWSFVAIRIFGAAIVVPFMEELFWRDYLWRTILAPNDFKLAKSANGAGRPFLVVSGAFATVHGNWWLTAIVWALLVGWLLVYTKSLGACIIAAWRVQPAAGFLCSLHAVLVVLVIVDVLVLIYFAA